jgi:hypothetical protein
MTKNEDEVTTMKLNELKDCLIGNERLNLMSNPTRCWLRVSFALYLNTAQ